MHEWVSILKPKLEVEIDFRKMMAGINIDDPIELEEKALDLRYRTKRLERELNLLKRTNGDIGNRVRGADAKKKAQEAKMAERLKNLESELQAKKVQVTTQKQELEIKIQQQLMAKDQVYQDSLEV
jgi:hypothetical protein